MSYTEKQTYLIFIHLLARLNHDELTAFLLHLQSLAAEQSLTSFGPDSAEKIDGQIPAPLG